MSHVTIAPHPTSLGVQRLIGTLLIPRPLDEVFPFFAAARNLEQITPPWLQFEVLTPDPIDMGRGRLIDYRLKLHGVRLSWRTEIAEWEPPHRFVDRQLSGPYRLWYHVHTFEERDGGTLVTDQVDYTVPGGRLVGRAIDWLFVRKEVRAIFEFRAQALAQRFNAKPAFP